jgi:hypothetical protein
MLTTTVPIGRAGPAVGPATSCSAMKYDRLVRWILCSLLFVGCHAKPKVVLRPLETGTFGKYKIEACASGGHVVKLTYVVDERGEAANRKLVESYRDRYLVPKLEEAMPITGWTFDSACGASGLTLRVPAKAVGEALRRSGEVLARNPTDIEVTVVGEK